MGASIVGVMEMPMHRLPPFPRLVAFDAVLRHGSVTRAAAELGLTQSAVSHGCGPWKSISAPRCWSG